MWAGRTVVQRPGWATAPGYGNSWNALMSYHSTVGDPSVGQTIGLDFVFNHDTEPGYDYFDVEYDSAGVAVRVFHIDGDNRDSSGGFVPLSFASQSPAPIVYGANGYGGPSNDEIVIRFALRTDGAWSDEDGKYASDGGAQVDDISVSRLAGSDFEGFEGLSQDFLWQPDKDPYAGDFGEVFVMVNDLDPCRENETPALGFIDDGRGPYNPSYSGTGTGGTVSDNWSYGVFGGWVVNYNGGISAGSLDQNNEWWSPEIEWDVQSTTADDGAEVVGARLRFSVWRHLPLENTIFYRWEVRGYEAGVGWDAWRDRSFVHYSDVADWHNVDAVVTDLLPTNRIKVQIRLAVADLSALVQFPGTDATPAPLFDNVSFVKYGIGGPIITARSIDLVQDSFAQNGATDVSSEASRDLMDVRVDMAADINTGSQVIVPGDSIVLGVVSVIPGVALSDSLNRITMHYSLNMNPLFEAAIRENAPATDTAAGLNGWDQHEGVITASQAFTSLGSAIQDRYFFDLSDQDFMYPEDVLEYYIRAEDDASNITTLPADIAGFDDAGLAYDRSYTMRALPTYESTDGSHPPVLFWNDFGRRGGEAAALSAFGQNGMLEGIHFDSYTTVGPSTMVSNGVGSSGAHGASSDQLDGYGCIIYEGGDLMSGLISDGSNSGLNDKGDDAGVLLGWWNTAGADRGIAHFADNLATMLSLPSSSAAYLSTVMNAIHVDADVRDQIGGQTAPLIKPSGAISGFSLEFVAYGGCFQINSFDSVTPGAGALTTHDFTHWTGYPMAPAGIYNGFTDGGSGRKQSLYFPYGFLYVQSPPNKLGPSSSAGAKLLEEVLLFFDGGHIPPTNDVPVDAPRREFELHPPSPNPFNPAAVLTFDLGREAQGSVKIYNLRGALVRSLAEGSFSAGQNTLRWLGRDDTGARVSSGVYLVSYQIDGFDETQEILMIK